MAKRAWMLSLSCVGLLIIGIAGGVAWSNYRFHQETLKRVDSDVAAFANVLAETQMDMKQSTPNPTTPLEKAYEVNVKVDVGQLYELWGNMYPELLGQGLSDQDLQQIYNGLTVIDMDILPPRTQNVDTHTVNLARSWITFFYGAIYPNNHNAPQPDAVYFSRLKSSLSSIAAKYRSYKSDPNFQVLYVEKARGAIRDTLAQRR